MNVRVSDVEVDMNEAVSDERGSQIAPAPSPRLMPTVNEPKPASEFVQAAFHNRRSSAEEHTLEIDPSTPKKAIHIGPFKIGRTIRQPLQAFTNLVSAFTAPPVIRDAAALTKSRTPQRPLRDLFGAFLAGGELEMSAHIARMHELIEALKWTVHDPANGDLVRLHFHDDGVDLSAADIYKSLGRSMQIFGHLYAARDDFSHAQLSCLKTLKGRLERYRELRTTHPSAGGASSASGAAHRPLRVTVLGGGPVGMRAALEMALLGHRVTVLEARDTCSRLNVLKLWEETTIDLDALGLKLIDPDYANKKQGRASTCRLQLSLLKAALLMGVQVKVDRAHTRFNLAQLGGSCDVLLLATGFQAGLYARLAEEATVSRYEAGGGASLPTSQSGIASDAFQPKPAGKAPAAALAVVCHFARAGTTPQSKAWQRNYEPFDWTVQDARGADDPMRLAEMQRKYGRYCIAPRALAKEGILLENIITYQNKGGAPFTSVPSSYYFIFTLRAEMITACRDDPNVKWPLIKMAHGAPTEGGSRALLQWAKSTEAKGAGGGLDQACLDRFVKRVVTLFTEGYASDPRLIVAQSLPTACALLRETDKQFPRSVDLFDFSERNSLQRAAEVVTAVGARPLAKPMLVLPVGDALQEPFWPEGLGINRGMHNALDACWAANRWPEARAGGHDGIRELVRQRDALYNGKTLQMHGKNRCMLQGYKSDNSKGTSPQPAHSYTPDPATRYHAPLFPEAASASSRYSAAATSLRSSSAAQPARSGTAHAGGASPSSGGASPRAVVVPQTAWEKQTARKADQRTISFSRKVTADKRTYSFA